MDSNTKYDDDRQTPEVQYDEYREAADTAYEDSLRAYENMDRWMLALTGGAFGVTATQIDRPLGDSWLFFLGLCAFGSATCILLFSKLMSYKKSQGMVNDIESVFEHHPNDFVSELHKKHAEKIDAYNRKNDKKNNISLILFTTGIALVLISSLPCLN